jgi:Uma2 family endonuclease
MLNPKTALPRLETGDRLVREEFHRRYEARPDIKKAELVDGVVYVASAVRFGKHSRPHAMTITWLGSYASRQRGVELADNGTVFLGETSEVQPDACLFRFGPDGPRLTPDDYLDGAPQLVLEVAASSVDYDLGTKLEVYRRNGVAEYVVWRVLDGAIDWFRLRGGQYERVEPDERGVIESEIFPGLRLNVQKMLTGDIAGVLAELERR